MGRSVNKMTVIGTLGRDPEMRYMPNGNAVVNLSIATDESYNDKQSGQKVEQTEWHRITAYGKLAEIIGQYLKKGSKAYIEGKLRTREWEKDGIKRYTTEIIANDMMMLDGRSDGGSSMAGMSQAPAQAMQQAPSQAMAQQQRPQQAAPAQPMAQPQQAYQQPAAQQPVQAQQPQQGFQPQRQPAPAQQPQQQAQQPQQGQGYQQQPVQQPVAQPTSQPANSFDDFDDDIPF